jgi:phage terminase small subunit
MASRRRGIGAEGSAPSTRLTPKQQAFVFEYLKDLNATQAAIRAGYSGHTAKQQGQRLLTNVDVAKRLSEALAARQVAAYVESERLEREAERISSISDIRRLFRGGRFLPIEELPDDIAGAIASIETVIRKGDDGPEQIRKVRFLDKNTAVKTLFQLRGDGKVNDQNVNVKGDLAITAVQQEMELATKHMTPEEFERSNELSRELMAFFQLGLGRASGTERG